MNIQLRIFLVVSSLTLVSASGYAAEAADNGTDPTKLSTSALIQYKHTDLNLRDVDSTGLIEAQYTQPLGAEKRMSLTVNLPFASGVVDNGFDFGDASLKLTHVVDLNRSRGLAYTAEVIFDTAARDELGAGHTWLKASGFYAKFLPNGIFAPALVQAVSLSDPDNRTRINSTTLDLYYVPKLANPKYFITYDPALTYDWENEKDYASLTVTFGRMLGRAFGGDSQMYIKPQILAGGDRPVDWSIQAGYKVLGF